MNIDLDVALMLFVILLMVVSVLVEVYHAMLTTFVSLVKGKDKNEE